ncbi:MAG: CHC2 zinc finger domain-containing protein, partial [Firmicutes bacterium]|nr:CHC2 zinc finger domain-containing protein [Bacillota bacterium]
MPLKKKGPVWVGLCPFHADHDHPNFTVYPGTMQEQGHYYCFACKTYGTVIDWVQNTQHLSYAKALQYLQQATNLPVPAAASGRDLGDIWGEWQIPRRWITAYQAVWPHLTLHATHWAELVDRGLDPATIEIHGFRSVPLERTGWFAKLQETAETFHGIPGFSWKDDGHFHGPAGFLIPVRNRSADIIAAQIHPDNSDLGKYLWWSTSDPLQYPGGASSGSPPHWAWPSNAPYHDVDELWITEGPLKAIIAAETLQVPVLGVAGIGRYNAVLSALQETQARRVIVAFDADTQTEP